MLQSELFNDWRRYVSGTWGLQEPLASMVAGAQTYIQQHGGEPVRITSGYRDPRRQRLLQARWDAGNRAGLVARPASRSWHMQGLAVDVSTRSPNFPVFRWLMIHWGARWGGNFSSYDPVHFDTPNGRPRSLEQLIG